MMASQNHTGGTATSVAQQQQGVTQQQLQIQQPTTTATLQGTHQTGAQNQMQPLQVIHQSLQNQTLMPQQFYNTQGQLLMPGNIAFHHGLNSLNPQIQQAQLAPSIQVISAGKALQPNQLSTPYSFNTSYTIPTSAANNQAYIIGQLNSHPSILQQQQTTKPGEMQKVIQPQIGTTAQIPAQTMWAIPQFLNQNSILIRGTQPDQMFIQQQQPLQNNTNTHQHFTMPLTTTQLPATSISSATTNGVQQVTQQQAQMQQQTHNQQQSQQGQSQTQTQITTTNVVQIKAQATLQPKPPLQIQPQPAQNQSGNQNQQHQSQQNQQQQQQQQQHQNQQLQQQQQQLQQQLQQMAHQQQQIQMIPQGTATSQSNMLQQQILAQNQQTLTTQVMHQAQQAPRQLTILPQGATQQLQPQSLTLIQQQPATTQQPQPIRPNYSTAPATSTTISQQQGITTTATPQQRAKMRKPGVGRGSTNASPTQQAKVMFPRPTIPTTISPLSAPLKPAPSSQQPVGATLTKVSISAQGPPQSVNNQPLKTINLAALHTPPTLPDATLTPLMPQSSSQGQTMQQPPTQPLQVFAAPTTQLPSPNISITPAPPPPKKEEHHHNDNSSSQAHPPSSQQQQQNNSTQGNQLSESKSENEKENTKTDTNTEESEESTGKQKLPKAMVKPQVLTHVIEGFVIQEASEPFPLGRNGDSDEPPLKKVALSGEMGKCEMCGKVDLRSKFKKNKRFCSSQCAKGMKAQQQQQNSQPSSIQNTTNNHYNNVNDSRSKSKGKKWGESGESELTDETSSSVGEPSLMSPSTEQVDEEPKVNPVKWNVSEVVDFVRSLPGCAEYADDFALQEIDGQALMLLKEDHLMSAMGMKLGPALKLCAKIELIKAGMSSANGDGNQSKA